MSIWIVIGIIAVALGFILGNILLLKDSNKGLDIPKDMKKRKYDDEDEDNW